MHRVDKGEPFIVTVALWDESTGKNASGQIVYYDVRDENDSPLTPAISGTLMESTVTSGIYITTLTIDIPGNYICYATASSFYSSSEEVIVNQESIYDITKQTQSYNISVEDVLRTTVSGNASQTARNVPLNKTDYLITWIKADDDVDWANPVTSGTIFAWYKNISDSLPYKMSGPF